MDETTAGVRRAPAPNVGEVERWVSGVAGGMLVLRGLTKRSMTGVAMAFVGGWLLDRGLTGRSETYEKLGIDTTRAGGGQAAGAKGRAGSGRAGPAAPSGERAQPPSDAGERPDEVEQASEESFPASDSPSWTPDTHLGGPPHDRQRDRTSGGEDTGGEDTGGEEAAEEEAGDGETGGERAGGA